MRIYKYGLPLAERYEIRLPRGAKPLYVGEQDGALLLWAMVDPEQPRVPLEICIAGTGREWPAGFSHFATVQMLDGYVWHIGIERRKVYR